MRHRALAIAVGTLLVASAPALAAPTAVVLRVEGKNGTLFEGLVITDGKRITKDASGPHPCDGTNAGRSPTPGPTMTSALDDASIEAGFSWGATWNDGFQDFLINRIGADSNTSDDFWGLARNFRPIETGGCQERVRTADEALFAYDMFDKRHLLALRGPARVATGRSATVTVTSGLDGPALADAVVAGRRTDSNGRATVSFSSPGVKGLKAERSDSVRSNTHLLCVYRVDTGGCGTRDRVDPVVRVSEPKNGRRYRRVQAFAGRIGDAGGLRRVQLKLRRYTSDACRWFDGRRGRFTRPRRSCGDARFFRIRTRRAWSHVLPRQLPAGLYVLDVRAVDRSRNVGRKQIRFRVI